MNILKYNHPANYWEEALPLGNGRMGAMVFGGTAQEQIDLNEDTIWSGRPSDETGYSISENIGEVRRLIRDGFFADATELTDKMTGAHDTQSYQMAGTIRLDFAPGGEVTDYERLLDISSAVSTVAFERDGAKYSRESFISAPHQVMAMRLTSDKPGTLSFAVSMDSQMRCDTRSQNDFVVMHGTTPFCNHSRNADQVIWEQDGKTGMSYVAKIKVISKGGTVTASEDQVAVEAADEAVLLVAIKTGFAGFDQEPSNDVAAMEADCDKAINEAAAEGWDRLKAAHSSDYRALYDRVTIDLGATDDRPTDQILAESKDPAENTALANLVFNYGRYLLISSSRPGTQPGNLQGIWNNKLIAPWRSNYTININTEMNYWPAETCNLSDCAEPLLTMVREAAQSGKRAARQLYGARGWCLHHNTDLWRYPYTGGSKAQHAFWPVCGAWLCQHLWEHFLFTQDRKFLADAMPIMKEAAAFFLDFMIEDEIGQLTTSPSTSPENTFYQPETDEQRAAREAAVSATPEGEEPPKRPTASVCQGSAMDLTMIRELFENIIEGASLLGDSDDLTDEIRKALPLIAMPTIGKDGRILEFGIEADEPQPGHRHISHLYGVYPGWMFTPDNNADYFEACRKSLDARGDKSTGWAMGWRVAMWARLLDGNRALNVIGNLMTYVHADKEQRTMCGGGLYANLWDAHPPFQIDGNFGVTAGMAEMLLQSHQVINGERVISLLPALPDAWPSGSAKGLRARGGLEVSMTWKHGKINALSIEASSDIDLIIRFNGTAENISLKAGEQFELGVD